MTDDGTRVLDRRFRDGLERLAPRPAGRQGWEDVVRRSSGARPARVEDREVSAGTRRGHRSKTGPGLDARQRIRSTLVAIAVVGGLAAAIAVVAVRQSTSPASSPSLPAASAADGTSPQPSTGDPSTVVAPNATETAPSTAPASTCPVPAHSFDPVNQLLDLPTEGVVSGLLCRYGDAGVLASVELDAATAASLVDTIASLRLRREDEISLLTLYSTVDVLVIRTSTTTDTVTVMYGDPMEFSLNGEREVVPFSAADQWVSRANALAGVAPIPLS